MLSAMRVIIEEEARSGSLNMAIDEVLLESALERGIHTLRWYRWSEPTLSLGYFQKLDDPSIPVSVRKLPVVRRLSGGGAIVHHREWTYSCAVPAISPFSRNPGDLYKRMHRAMMGALCKHGVETNLRGESLTGDRAAFLCFSRGDANDVMYAGHKVIGSAQRRRRGAILQHGSLLLRASPYAAELPGLYDLAPPAALAIDASQLLYDFAEGMGNQLAEELLQSTLTGPEMGRALELEREKYRDLRLR